MRFHHTLMAMATVLAATGAASAQDKDITIVVPTAVDVVEPCHMNSTGYIGLVIRDNVVEPLVQLDVNDSSPQPWLATGWEQIDDKTWRVTLREGVTFHDGTPFNAEAVKKAFERLFVPELQCRDKIRLFGDETVNVNIIDDYTVEIAAETAQPLMPIKLASIGMTAPSSNMTEAERHPIGTGPYVFETWDAANSLVYSRNENYWGDQPEVENVTYIWRPEPALRAQMVTVGEADIAIQLAPQDANNPETDTGYLNANTLRARIFMDKAPLDDIRVRKALNLAVDREAFIGTVLSAGAIPASQYMLPSVKGYNSDLTVWPYDPDRAKQLLDEARADGVDVDAPIQLYGSDHTAPNASELFETLVQYWNMVGLNVELQMVDKIQLAAMRRKPYPDPREIATMVIETHDNTSGDAVFTVLVYYTSEGQLSNISDPKLDEMIREGGAMVGDERVKTFEEVNHIVQQEIVPDVIIAYLESFIRVGPRVNYEPDYTSETRLRIADITFNQ